MALAGVVGAQLFLVQAVAGDPHDNRGSRGARGCLVSAALVVLVKLPPFIATLGRDGDPRRGLAFIITEGQYFDVSTQLPGGWRPLGLPAAGSRRSS